MKRTTWWQRWRSRFVGGALLLAGAGGCKQQVILEPGDWQASLRPGVPTTLETHPHEPILPGSGDAGIRPSTVRDFNRQQRPLSLKEAFAIAVEQGNVGSGIGTGTDNATNLTTQFVTPNQINTDSIKAFLYDPAIAQADIERSLSKFDARWTTSMTWTKQDQATLTLQQSFSNGDTANLTSTLAKPLPTGGVAGITTSMGYLKLAAPPANNSFVTLATSYTPTMTFVFEQPLLKGFGIETNQVLNAHPGSLLAVPGLVTTGQGVEGILVTRVRAEQARAQFDVNVNNMLLNVETAYWNLYASYFNLYAQQKGLEQGLAGYLYYLARSNARDPNDPPEKKGIDAPYLLPQAEAQYLTFRLQVLQARADLLNAERQLRGLLGMRSNDGTVFVPTDEPTRTPQIKDFAMLWEEAVQFRPELLIARQDLKAKQLNLMALKNQRMPDLRAFGSYNINGLGSGLTGPQFNAAGTLNNSLASFAANQYNSWQIGLRLDMPIGFRDANGQVREAQLGLVRSWMQIRDWERKSYEFLVDAYRTLEFAQERMTVARTNKLALQEQVARFEGRVQGGINTSTEFINLTQAQRDLATRTSDEFKAVADYNAALARIEYAKGSIQRYAGVAISEGPLPPHVEKKAADHFRARAAGLKLREQPNSSYGMLQSVDLNKPIPALPIGGSGMGGTGIPGGAMPPGTGYPGLSLPVPQPATPFANPLAQPGVLPTTPSTPAVTPPSAPIPVPPSTTGSPVNATPAPSSYKPYDKWSGQTGNPGNSLPSSLPSVQVPVSSPANDQPGNNPIFQPIRDVTLPTRPFQNLPPQ